MFVFTVPPECTFSFRANTLSKTHTRTHEHTQLHPLHRFENQRKPISSNGKIIDEAAGAGGGGALRRQ
jgi:hypothetical protein